MHYENGENDFKDEMECNYFYRWLKPTVGIYKGGWLE